MVVVVSLSLLPIIMSCALGMVSNQTAILGILERKLDIQRTEQLELQHPVLLSLLFKRESWELPESGRFSRWTKCMTHVLPSGRDKADRVTLPWRNLPVNQSKSRKQQQRISIWLDVTSIQDDKWRRNMMLQYHHHQSLSSASSPNSCQWTIH